MQYSSALLEALITELTRLPGLGRKSAQRIAFHMLRTPEADARRLADTRRDASLLCVVEQPMDVLALERTGEFRGRYHVLKGSLSPVDGIGPDQLRLTELLRRVREGQVREVIVATNPTAQGEATALYIARLLQSVPDLIVTRIARGVPMGSDLEFSDQVTLARALSGRKEIG
jgi:recombination protein RecR